MENEKNSINFLSTIGWIILFVTLFICLFILYVFLTTGTIYLYLHLYGFINIIEDIAFLLAVICVFLSIFHKLRNVSGKIISCCALILILGSLLDSIVNTYSSFGIVAVMVGLAFGFGTYITSLVALLSAHAFNVFWLTVADIIIGWGLYYLGFLIAKKEEIKKVKENDNDDETDADGIPL